MMARTHLLIISVTKYSGHPLAFLLLPIVRCWCAVHLQWSTSPASPTWTSWATASIRDSPTRRCVTASRTIDAFQPPLRIFWDRASWTIMCSLGREHFIPLTLPTCDHAIYLSIICINIPGVLSKRKHDCDTEQSLFYSAKSRFSIAFKLFLIWRGRYVALKRLCMPCGLQPVEDDRWH